MLFVQSLRGLSHTKLEDTKPEHLELAVAALDRLASKTIDARRGVVDARRARPGARGGRRGPRRRLLPHVERLERRRGRRPTRGRVWRLARRDRAADDGAVRHAPALAAPRRHLVRPDRPASGGARRVRVRGARERDLADRRRDRARDRRPARGGSRLRRRLRRRSRPRPCRTRRTGDAGRLRRRDDGRGRSRARGRAAADRRDGLAGDLRGGARARGRRGCADRTRARPAPRRAPPAAASSATGGCCRSASCRPPRSGLP